MLSSYYTVKKQALHEIIVQNSRFLAHIKRVETEAEAQTYIETIKKEHWKANHNCFAYVIGDRQQIQKASDDGEPSGTAGFPMLDVLKKKDLRDTIVIVTRYFGGTKLGAGGLIRAYTKATSEGLKAAGLVVRTLMNVMRVTIDYTLLGTVENELRQSNYAIKNIDYTDNVTIDVYVQENNTDTFIEWLTNITSGQATIRSMNFEYVEGDVL